MDETEDEESIKERRRIVAELMTVQLEWMIPITVSQTSSGRGCFLRNTLEHGGSSGSEMPAWVKLMKESPTLVILDRKEVERLEATLGLFGSIRFPRVQRLVSHVSEDFLFLDGPDCSHLPGERGRGQPVTVSVVVLARIGL
jgi:hypothetical protein